MEVQGPGLGWGSRELRKQVFEGKESGEEEVWLGKLGPRAVGTGSLLLTASGKMQASRVMAASIFHPGNLTKDCLLQQSTETIDSKN